MIDQVVGHGPIVFPAIIPRPFRLDACPKRESAARLEGLDIRRFLQRFKSDIAPFLIFLSH